MVSEGRLRLTRDEGERAKQLLENPTLTSAFDAMERAYFDAWRGSKPDDPAHRERIYMMFQCTTEVRRVLRQKVEDAILADAQLKAAGLT